MRDNKGWTEKSDASRPNQQQEPRLPRARSGAAEKRHPVIGALSPWHINFGTGYEEYITPTMRGLAKVSGRRLDLLVIAALHPGRGDCARFLAECMAAYETICVWDITNPRLEDMLERRGFRYTEDRAERETGRRWDASRGAPVLAVDKAAKPPTSRSTPERPSP